MNDAGTAIRRLGGLLLLVVLAVSLDLPLQASPVPVALFAAVFAVAGAIAETIALVALLALAPILPVLGMLWHGPLLAPLEIAALAVLAGVLLRGAPGPEGALATPLGVALAVAACAALLGGVAATLAAVPFWALPGALSDFAKGFYAVPAQHAAAPLHAAVVHAVPLLVFLGVGRILTRSTAARVVRLLVAALVAVALFGVVEAAAGFQVWPRERYDAFADYRRVVSTVGDHNALAALLSLLLFPALALASRGPTRTRVLGLSAAAVLGICLLLTGSRASWLATAVAGGATLAVLFARGSGLRSLAAVVLLGLVFVATAVLWPGATGARVRQRVLSLVRPAETRRIVEAGRVGFWRAGVRMAASAPVFGVGVGRVPARFGDFADAELPVREENVHSYPIQLGAELGIGAVFLLLPFVLAAHLVVEAARAAKESTHAPEVLAIAPGMLAVLISGLVSHPWLLVEVEIVFWGGAALVAHELGQVRAPRAFRVVALSGALVWGLAAIVALRGRDLGRFGFGDWGPEAGLTYRWIGPRALFTESPRDGAVRLLARRRGDSPNRVRFRASGGPWTEVGLSGAWEEERIPLGEGAPLADGRVLVEARADGAFCPDRVSPSDRRILSFQLGSR